MPAVRWFSTHRRWLVVGLLAAFGVANYLDRQALSVLAPTLRQDLGISTEQYSYVVSIFLAAYAIGYAIAGRTLDRIGAKAGLGLALGFWSLVAMAHALVSGWRTLALGRFLLGLGQSFNAPGGFKAIAEWIPPRERGLCSAIFSNGNNLGAVLAPPIIGTLALWFGWRWAFAVGGALGFIPLAIWWARYDSPERAAGLSEPERTLILQSRPAAAVSARPLSYREILRDPRCVGLCVLRLLTDPVSYFIAFWLTEYFQTVRGFSLQLIALLGWLPYLASPLLGGPLGGALSDWLVRRGVRSTSARLRLMLAAACLMPLSLLAVRTGETWLAIALITVLVAANSCWTVNHLTLASELVPRESVASLLALGGVAGSIGGVLSTLLAGRLIATVGYVPVFTGLGFLHLAAFALVWTALRGRPPRAALVAA